MAESDDQVPVDFQALVRALRISEVRALIAKLREHSEFQIPADFESLDLRALNFLRRQLRDTLRSLGGGR